MTGVASAETRIFESAETLARDVAEWLCGLAQASDRAFAVSLSGGSTPRRLYEHLAAPEIASRFPWNRTHWFWGDERFVSHDHRDSNFRMASEAFLSLVPVPGDNIHAVPTEGLSPEQAAIAYETTLKRFYGADALAPGRPLFDVTLLGIGEDGHTASWFPGQPALRILLTQCCIDSKRKTASRRSLRNPVRFLDQAALTFSIVRSRCRSCTHNERLTSKLSNTIIAEVRSWPSRSSSSISWRWRSISALISGTPRSASANLLTPQSRVCRDCIVS
jgi:6-phosphogluconolactonase